VLPCTYLRACICRAARAVRSRPSRARRRTFTFRGPARPNVYTFVRKTTTFAHVHVYGCVFVVPPTFGLAVSRFEPRRRRTIDRFRQQRTVRSAAPGDDFVSTPSDARRSHAAVGITEVYPSASRKYASKENVLFIYACTVPSPRSRCRAIFPTFWTTRVPSVRHVSSSLVTRPVVVEFFVRRTRAPVSTTNPIHPDRSLNALFRDRPNYPLPAYSPPNGCSPSAVLGGLTNRVVPPPTVTTTDVHARQLRFGCIASKNVAPPHTPPLYSVVSGRPATTTTVRRVRT